VSSLVVEGGRPSRRRSHTEDAFRMKCPREEVHFKGGTRALSRVGVTLPASHSPCWISLKSSSMWVTGEDLHWGIAREETLENAVPQEIPHIPPLVKSLLSPLTANSPE